MINSVNGVCINVDKVANAISNGIILDAGGSHVSPSEARNMAFNMLMGAKFCIESEGDVINMHCADCTETEDAENRMAAMENALRNIADKLMEAQRKEDWDTVNGVVGTINALI